MKGIRSLVRSASMSAAFLLAAFGCVGGGPANPVLPSNGHEGSGVLTQPANPETSGHYLWGYYTVRIDEKDYSAEIMPIRETAGHWNVLQFLEQWPCTNCFKLAGVSPNPDGTLNVNVSIKQPFANLNLTGFDVRGIAMFSGSHLFPESGLVMSDRTLGEGEVVNADGFTTLFNPTTAGHGFEGYVKGKLATVTAPGSTLNGYKRFVTDDPANTRNAFYAGDEIIVTFQIDMPDPPNPWVFGYAVDASWAPAINKPVDDPMTDFGLSANCPEPWKIEVTDTPVGDGLTDCGGQTKLTIDVYDWQEKDDAHAVVAECPELFDGEVTATWKADAVGFTTYEALVENTKNAPAGTYRCLVSKEAKENDLLKPWLNITAYQLHELEVVVKIMETPTAVAEASQPSAYVGEAISFDASGSHDNDCGGQSIVTYEWDWENDGTYDEEGIEVDHSWSTEGTYYVQLRVTDDESQTDTLDEPLEITINKVKVPPVAIATADPLIQEVNQPIHFSDDGSYDSDGGSIVKYEWDWDNDGTYDEEGVEVDHSWPTEGTYYVQFRVTDDESQTDTLDTALEVTIIPTKVPPIAMATADPLMQEVNQPIHFSDDGSYDPDGGPIIKYEWDWDNDGTYDEEGVEVDHSWPTEGTYYVQFRVTDDDSQTGTLDTPLEVVIWSLSGSLNWAKRAGGVLGDIGFAVTTLSDDSTVMTGIFLGSSTFGPGETNQTVLTAAAGEDVFVAKYNPDGSLAWAKSAGGPYNDEGYGIAALSDDSTVLTGFYMDSAVFGQGESNQTTLKASGVNDIFVAKYNPDGTLAWAKSAGGGMPEQGYGVTALSDNTTVVTGVFGGSATFGKGESNSTKLNASGTSDIFVARYNANGTLAWAKRAGGSNADVGNGVTTLSDDSTVVTGIFASSATFGPGEPNSTSLSSAGGRDVFVAKYNTNGTLAWAKRAGGTSDDYAYGVAALPDNTTVVTGYYTDAASFGPGESGQKALTSAGAEDIFVARYNTDGTLAWANSAGGALMEFARAITALSDNTTVLTGRFAGSATFGAGESNETVLSVAGINDVFVARYNANGTLAWARRAGSKGQDQGNGITALTDNSSVVTGYFEGNATFGQGEPNQTVLTTVGSLDIFIARFLQ